ncbi:RhuM family protein [Chlorobium phaeobacteroides]|uniref:Putative virulence protein n=1 Tax=Chlorobium phaeobacteroides (strain DSM 266 / SMG 266 / 2430) TaxID=290317 RepID=A1BE84_CHLPD|nr:RhuM family protein [Chlorobium phaeobacteroides]ABL64711.1 putative virulence protein [Chlorobium phaeobacteroides DSM 266]
MMQPVTYPENKDSGRGNIVFYQAGNTSPKLEARLEDESLWLSLNQLSDLFGRDKSFLSRYLRNIYESCELDRKTTVGFFATVQKEGGRQIKRQIEYFNLDAIISVGYRVNSKQGTRFHIRATSVLRNHIIRWVYS